MMHLLYEQGPNLELAVKLCLTELGCYVQEIADSKHEDLRFQDPLGNDWICEIKGRKGGLKREDIRQLDDWIKISILESQWTGYGVLIGNFQIHLDPKNRKDYLPENEVTSLKRFKFALIETTSLFEQLVKKENGTYDKNQFWEATLNGCEKK